MASVERTSNNNNNNNSSSSSSNRKDEKNSSSSNNDKDAGFECNICLETARDAVLSLCGHLFCWPCIHQWMETRADNPTCPVCKSSISRDKLVPVYGRSGPQTDPRDTIPPRPAGTRQEPRQNRNSWFGDGVNFQMSFGVGAFPFGLFQTTFATNNFNQPQYHAPSTSTQEGDAQELLSRIFLGVAIVMLLFIIFN